MDCPRCSEALVEYELRGRAAGVCEACGYVGVAIDHGGDLEEVESWDEALRRFRRRS